MPPSPRRIAVVGAGITGLAAAHHVLELAGGDAAGGGATAIEVALFEASPRAGGIVATFHGDDGLRLEDGPDSFLTEKPAALGLLRRLGLESRVVGTNPAFRTSFVVAQGRLRRTPPGFQLLAPVRALPFLKSPILSPWGRLRALAEPLIPPRTRDVDAIVDESLGAFVRRRFGSELLSAIAQPMIGGIYGADPERLSLLATFPRYLRLEAEHGSVLRGLRVARVAEASGPRYGLFASLAGGMQELTDALAARLPKGALRLRTPVTGLAREDDHWLVATPTGNERFDAVILTLAAPATGRLVADFDRDLGRALGGFPRGSSACVTFAFRAADVAHPLDGAGFVAPRREGFLLLGASFAHRKFADRAPADRAIVRAFFDERAFSFEDAALVARARAELAELLGVASGAAPFARVVRWENAMPHYHVGHLDRVAALRARMAAWPGLQLAGNSYAGVGLPDCIAAGEAAAEAVLGRAGAFLTCD